MKVENRGRLVDDVELATGRPTTSVFGVLLARIKGQLRYQSQGQLRYWPDEDLVSELTAAVINAVPGLGGFLIANLPPPKDGDFKPALRAEVAARTQVYTAKTTKRHVDLELAAAPERPAAAPERLVWIEGKGGARESRDQLARYNEQLKSRAEQRGFKAHQLIYLTPTGERPKEPGLGAVAAVSWHEFAVCLKAGLELYPDDPAGWIVDDYLRYLKERDLGMANPLSGNLPETVQRYRDARETLRSLHALVIGQLPANWERANDDAGKFSDGVSAAKSFREWPQWWGVYIVRAREAVADEFDFALESETELSSIECGLIWRYDSTGSSWEGDTSFVEAVLAAEVKPPFEMLRRETLVRLGRQLPLSEVTTEGTSLAGQAKLIADFIEETFTLIESRLGLLRNR